jgi:ribosomal protein S24E
MNATNTNSSLPTLPLIRIDRNIIHNIDGLFDLFEIGNDSMDDNLLRAVIYYVCFSYQHNLFTYSIFDPHDFAKEMSYTMAYLRMKHPQPLFMEDLKKKTKEEQDYHFANNLPCYSNNIENALYTLWKKEILFNYGAKFFNSTDKEVTLTAHQNTRMFILRNLQITTLHSGKTKQSKTVYSMELDDRFIHNLTKYFIRSNKNILIELRKSKLDILYLKILQQKERAILAKEPNIVFENFETLCRWAGIPQGKKNGEAIAPKKRKQQVIIAFNTIKAKTDLDFTLTSVTARRQKFPYTFVLQFNNISEQIATKDGENKQDMMSLFDEVLSRDMFEFFKSYKCSHKNPFFVTKNDLLQWLFADCDYDEKKQVYLIAAAKIFGKETAKMKASFYSREKKFDHFYRNAVREKKISHVSLLSELQ